MRVEVLTDRPEQRFAPGRVLHVEGTTAPLTVATAHPVEDGPGWRLTFREVPDRTGAERLRDAYLETVVDRDEDLGPDELYWHEVVGMRVRGRDGRDLGTVAEVYRAGEAEVYVVRGGPVGEFDLPAVRGVLVEVSRERGEIVVDEDVLALEEPPVDAAPRPPRRRPRWSRHGKGGVGGADRDAGGAAASDGPADGSDSP